MILLSVITSITNTTLSNLLAFAKIKSSVSLDSMYV